MSDNIKINTRSDRSLHSLNIAFFLINRMISIVILAKRYLGHIHVTHISLLCWRTIASSPPNGLHSHDTNNSGSLASSQGIFTTFFFFFFLENDQFNSEMSCHSSITLKSYPSLTDQCYDLPLHLSHPYHIVLNILCLCCSSSFRLF